MKSFIFLLLSLLPLLLPLSPITCQPPSPGPKWPLQFQATFGLYQFDNLVDNTPIFNETSEFYYDFNVSYAQLINYPTRCVALLSPLADKSPCQILFNKQGVYFSQPQENVECCLMFQGVGPSPPNFLEGFTWNGTNSAPDFYGW